MAQEHLLGSKHSPLQLHPLAGLGLRTPSFTSSFEIYLKSIKRKKSTKCLQNISKYLKFYEWKCSILPGATGGLNKFDAGIGIGSKPLLMSPQTSLYNFRKRIGYLQSCVIIKAPGWSVNSCQYIWNLHVFLMSPKIFLI